MHILIIPAWFPSENDLTSGIFNQKQAEALAAHGQEVGVLFFENQLFQPFHFWKIGLEIKSKPVNLIKKNGFWFLPKSNKWLLEKWILIYDRLFKQYLIKFGKPDILHGFGLQSCFIAQFLSEKYNIPFVFTEHASAYPRGLVPVWQQILLKNCWEKAGKVTAVSRGMALEMQKIWPHEISITPTIFLEKDFPEPIFSKEKKTAITFLTACGLEPKKGVDLLILAFEKLCETTEIEVKLVIVGSGALREKISIQLKNSPFSNKMELFESLRGSAFRQKYLEADCFVLASRHETFGTVLIEAMACGLPVIATKSGGPEFFISEKMGILVEANSAKAIFKGMELFLTEKSNFDPTFIRKNAVENYSENPGTARFLNIYAAILG
jgi:L-malate glycosyltransferase